MSDIEIKLEPQDEYNHEPDEASNYNESMYFNVFDHNKQMAVGLDWVIDQMKDMLR